MTDVFELSDRLIEHGITRIQIAKMAGRSLGHVCMVLNLVQKFSDVLMLSEVNIDQLTEARLEISLINLKYFIKNATEEDIIGLSNESSGIKV